MVSTCECTAAEWPKRPIEPGGKGKIEFQFDSSKKDSVEEISIDVFLKNVDQEGNPIAIFLTYSYEF